MNNEKRAILRTTRDTIQTHIASLTTLGDNCTVDGDNLKSLLEQTKPIAEALDCVHDTLVEHQEEEQSKFENLSEGLQVSDMGQNIEQAAQQLEYAQDAVQTVKDDLEAFTIGEDTDYTDLADTLQSAVDELEEAINNINDAIGD